MALSIKNLEALRGSFGLSIPSMTCASGEMLALVGPSGCGKSTFLLTLGGFVPARAKITINEQPIDSLPPERRNIALLFQRPALFPHLNVSQNVEFGLRVRGISPSVRRKRAQAALQRVHIADLGERMPPELSGGQMQRVALARVLVVEPPVLLLDEPFSSLDPPLRRDVRALVKELVTERAMSAILVTHDPADLKVCSRVVGLEQGRIAYEGPASIEQSDWLAKFVEG